MNGDAENQISDPAAGPAGPEGAPAPVDVDQLMERVRRSVDEKRRAGIYRDDEWAESFHYGPALPASPDGLSLLRASARVELEGEPIKSHRPVAGSVVMALKRFTRYWVRKYTDPLFLRQGTFNAETVNALAAVRREVEELRAEVARLKAVHGAEDDPGEGQR